MLYIYICSHLIGIMLPKRQVGVDGGIGIGVLVIPVICILASVELGRRLNQPTRLTGKKLGRL